MKLAIFIAHLLQMLPTKFRFIWPSGSEEKIFFKSANQKQELPVSAMFVNGSGKQLQSLQRSCNRCYLPNFSSFGRAVSEEKNFQKSTNQKKEWPVAAMFVNGSELNEQSLQKTFQECFLPSLDSFGQAFQKRRFLEINQSATRMACGGHVCQRIKTKSSIFIEDLQ